MQRTTDRTGELLRGWRQRRRLSQLELAGAAGVSTRHLSFLETGRALPSREMLLRLSSELEIPLREQNRLLIAAGFAPRFPERSLDDPALDAARLAVGLVLTGHEPNPALALDAHGRVIATNRSIDPLIAGVAPELLAPPISVYRLTLHPDGLAPRIENLGQVRQHLLERLERRSSVGGDPAAEALLKELRGYPAGQNDSPPGPERALSLTDLVIPFRLRTPYGVMTFLTTTTVFGSPLDITLAEIAIESFFPADAATRRILASLEEQRRQVES